MSVSLNQPMRPAEIELVGLANKNELAIAQEIADRTAADTTLQNNITEETAAREQADTTLTNNLNDEIADRTAADTTLQNNITEETAAREQADSGLQASIDEINAKFPVATANIADGAVSSDKILNGSINANDLNENIQSQLSFLASVPEIEFGTSNSFTVSGNNYTDVTVTFTAKTGEPIVFCSLQHTMGNLAYVLTDITNQQFTARVYNLSSTDVSDITLNWLTISGR